MSSLNLSTIQSNKTLPEFYATVDLIRTEHLEAAKASIQSQDILLELEEEIEKDCEWLRGFLFAAQVSDGPASRVASLDSHMPVGHRRNFSSV
jgi:aspartate kinase